MVDIASKLAECLDFEAALKAGAAERCGVITAAGEAVELPNIHSEPEHGFHMEPTCFLAEIQEGAIATWHTHPAGDPNLSHEDMNGFRQWPQLIHHILGIRDGKPTVHTFKVIDDIVVTA